MTRLETDPKRRLSTALGLPWWWFFALGIWGLTGAPLWLYLVAFFGPLGAGLFPLLPDSAPLYEKMLFAAVLYLPGILLSFAIAAGWRARRTGQADAARMTNP